MSVFTSQVPAPYGANNGESTSRGLGSSWFNAKDIAEEDYYRNLQAIDYQNAFTADQAERDRAWQTSQNALNRQFQSDEAQKNRDWQEHMESTIVERMKKQGINPILAYTSMSGGAPSGGVASGSTSGGSRGYSSSHGHTPSGNQDGLAGLLSTALQIGAGLITKGMSTKAQIAKAGASKAFYQSMIRR